MKRAVSISIGSSKRDKTVEIELLGEKVQIERIGTDGDMEKAAQMYGELDGKVDAFGVGGTDLGLEVDGHWYTLHSVQSMVRLVKKTPVVDGTGLKNTLEKKIVPYLEANIGDYIQSLGRKVLVTSGVDRWGMAASFADAGYDCIFGDLMFSLGIPIKIRSKASLKRLASLFIPIASRLPFDWVYPTGEKQEKRIPKWEDSYQWASIIAGDCHYVKRHMPDRMAGKVVATNTTTPADVEFFRAAGIKYLVTSTPVLDGRSFGTNMMEAALIAASGKARLLTRLELEDMLQELEFHPQLQVLN